MKDLNYLRVGAGWPSVMDLGYDEVVALMLDGQRYRALKLGYEKCSAPPGDRWDETADKLIREQKSG